MKRALLVLGLLAAGCAGSSSEGTPDRMLRPMFVDVDQTDRKLTYILDAARSGVFAWDGDGQNYNTGRAPGPENPKHFIAIPVGTDSELSQLDVLYTGFAVADTGSALAALYSFGFEDRTGHLTVVNLHPFPVDPAQNLNYTVPSGSVGPFATPEGRFVVISPTSVTEAVWRVFPEPVSNFTGPNAGRLAWNRQGTLLYAADRVNQSVHVFAWPAMTPVTSLTLPGRPIDLALHPVDARLMVVTSNELRLYGPPPTYAFDKSVAQTSLPIRVAFDRHESGKVVGVLNQNTTLQFYLTDTLCGVDVDGTGFSALNMAYVDLGDFSNPDLGEVAPVGCASDIPDQAFQLVFEGQVQAGRAAVTAPTALKGSFAVERIAVGDALFVGAQATQVTAVTDKSLFFAPVTQPIAIGTPVTFAVRATEQWTVAGSAAGYLGRVSTGEPFSNVIAFTISEGGAPPTRGDLFVFESDKGLTPVFLSGAPSDMAEDPYGRFVVTVPQNSQARAVNVKQDEGAWVIQTLYVIP